ncbi:hypothetical protein HBB04_01553 [Pseudomonas coronafaciens]|nr:hypothetical protein HBB04_01553 [Pseudomonas coronafaciens]
MRVLYTYTSREWGTGSRSADLERPERHADAEYWPIATVAYFKAANISSGAKPRMSVPFTSISGMPRPPKAS